MINYILYKASVHFEGKVMRTRHHEVGIDLAVSFDDDEKSITMSRYVRSSPAFQGEWEDVATFSTEASWYSSEYQSMIVGDGNVAMIACFWHDVAQSA